MRKIIALILVFGWITSISQNNSDVSISLLPSTKNCSVIKFKLNNYSHTSVTTPLGNANLYSFKGCSYYEINGAPSLPKISTSLIISDNDATKLTLVSSTYTDYINIEIPPSKGVLSRAINPSVIPYSYGIQYSTNSFWPSDIATTSLPYILRDFRGQNVNFCPFQYNPVTKVLRVYNEITVKLEKENFSGANQLNRTKSLKSIDNEFNNIYSRKFLNYNSNYKYTPVGNEHGNMLIICYGSFMSSMQPFVNWKNTIGIHTDIVDIATVGATSNAIKTYVANYYNTNGLAYLLLVGDASQIPTITSGYGGPTDNAYGYITGTDHYQEIFVGRFSAESVADVETQVLRSIQYEKTPATSPDIFNNTLAIASDQGPGDDSEYDYTHQRNIQTDLLNFTYTIKEELFDGSQGGLDASGNPTPAMVTNELNKGVGIITYTGHGANDQFVTSTFSSSNVANLSNQGKLPFIWSVACVNGEFNTTTCFAEYWLRSQKSGQPIGAVGALMSTINQSWNSPMCGQDEMVDILVESYTGNIKRTFGGISVNGLFKMIDEYGSDGEDMTDTWTIFGDPSLVVRTANPLTLNATHSNEINIGESAFTVNCNVNGAYVCISQNNEILGTGIVNGGSVIITFLPLSSTDSLTIAVTEFNYIPYLTKVEVTSTVYPNNAQIAELLDPQSVYNCILSDVSPKIIIRNKGTNQLSNLAIDYSIDNNTPIIYQWNGTLNTNESDTITLQSFSLSLGTHIIKVFCEMPNGNIDDNTMNDTIKMSFTVNNLTISSDFNATTLTSCDIPANITFSNTSANGLSYLWDFGDGTTSTDENPTHIYNSLGVFTVKLTAEGGGCGDIVNIKPDYITIGATPPQIHDTSSCGASSFILTANGSGDIEWYDSITGGSLLHTGNSYNVGLLSQNTTYYIESNISYPPQQTGEVNDSTNGGFLGYEHYLVFDCFEPCMLLSVEVNAQNSGSRTIELQNSTGTVIATKTVTIPAGKSLVTLNFSIPLANDLRLVGKGTPNLFRSNVQSSLNYPYTINGIVSIKGTSATSNPTGYYYYFYKWNIQKPSCSSVRVPISVIVTSNEPTADFTSQSYNTNVVFTNTSIDAANFFWNFGDGFTSTDKNPIHDYSIYGQYNVLLVVRNMCGIDSITKQVNISTGVIDNNSETSTIKLSPNPAYSGKFTILFDKAYYNVVITLYDINGKEVKKLISENQISKGKIDFDISEIISGIYFCKINSSEGNINKKLVILK